MKSTALLCLILFSSTVSALEKPNVPENLPGATTVRAEQVVEMILQNPDLIVIDSRKRSEYLKGHIEGAINILNTELSQKELKTIAINKSIPLLFYCNGIRCLRSADSITKAKKWGYTNLFWFKTGWKAWLSKRLPVVNE